MDFDDDFEWHALRMQLAVYSVSNYLEDKLEGVRTVYTDVSKGVRQIEQLREAEGDSRIHNFTRLNKHTFEVLLD